MTNNDKALSANAPTRAEALEQAKHAVSYAASMSLKDDDYVEICSSKLKIWKEFLSALTAPIEKVDGWLPIESAPKDGTRVLLLHDRYGAGSGHFDGRWHLHFCVNKLAVPDAWQPLPAPPSARLQLQRQGD